MSFLEDLNPVQRDAVRAVNGPVMIVAGAGSGKTRVLTYRTAHLIDLGVRPESVLALTFTNKAADEMKSRIVALVGEESRKVWMGTFHSIFARILRFECERIGYQRSFSIYDTDDSLSLVRSTMNSLGISQQQYTPQGIRSRISIAKNQMVTPSAYRESGVDPMTEKTAQVYEGYEKGLRQANAMDFDDLLLKPLELFSRHPDILERYQIRFNYILVDEYQDTNRVQYRLIHELATKHRNICVVGDDAQSIYAFRGADIRNILDFERDYPDAKVFRLEQNYRSTKTILSVADTLIRNNIDQIPKSLWTANPGGEEVVLHVCANDRDEGQRVVGVIEDESVRKKIDLKDFAVLYRTNAQSRAIEDALRLAGIPYIIVGGVAFYKRKEIKDILAYLRLVANPRDSESLLRVINVPARGIGETTIGKIKAVASRQRLSLFDALGSSHLEGLIAEKTLRAVRQLHALVAKYIGLKEGMTVSELGRAMVDDIGILQALKEENTPESLARRENVLELVAGLSAFNADRPEGKLEEFLEQVSLLSDIDVAEFGHNAVTLMTLHAAKGLEFPVVMITGLEEGLFPISSAANERRELEEERRLMYVGITRAQQKLYLSYAQMRYRFGEQTYSSRSRFLDEIDDHVSTLESPSLAPTTRPYRRKAGDMVPESFATHRQERARRPAENPYQSDPAPDYENESQEPLHVAVGTRVTHETFGAGRIVALDGRGENARAIVDFESVGRKHLMLKFAHLRLR
jgi:DNA helicase II / ATP-dependent DNA helicase PcrA